METNRKVHTLTKPLRIATANENDHFYLPVGTTLYLDASMDEGFDRYQVYINVQGNLPLAPTEKPGLIAPLSGYFDDGKKP